MLLRAGVDAKTVASLMGHSSVAMTLNVYASTDPQARAAAGAIVAKPHVPTIANGVGSVVEQLRAT